MPYEIRAYVDGYRRGGKAHRIQPTLHPDDAFTPEQLQQLRDDPRILIQEVDVPEAAQEVEADGLPSEPASAESKAAAKKEPPKASR